MYLNFNNIKLHNFFSFEDATLQLSDSGFVMIVGENNSKFDNAKSNGSGKSTLISEAISWCLTGETLRGVKSVRRNGGNDGCYVELDFNVDNNNYLIRRSKESKEFKTNLFIYKNSDNISGKGIRDSEQILKDTLPDVTAQLLNAVVILGQGLPNRFTNNSPSGRKDVLEKLSKSDFMVEDLRQRIEARSDQLSCQMKEIDNQLLVNTTKIEVAKKQIEQAKQQLNQLIPPIQYKDQIDELNESINNNKDLLQILNIDFDNKNKQYNDIVEQYNKLYAILDKDLNASRDHFDQLINTKQKEYNDLNSKIYALGCEINKLDSVSDVCPTCGQKLLNVKKMDTSSMKDELNQKKKILNEIYSSICDSKAKLTEQQNSIKQNHSQNLTSLKDKQQQLYKDLQIINSNKQQAQFVINEKSSKLNQLQLAVAQYTTKQQQLNSSIDENNNIIKTLSEEQLYINNNKSQLSSRVEIISKFNTSIKRDFRGFLLCNVIQYIDSKAKEYSQEIFNNQNIEFVLDGNNISIKFNDKEYEALSGGEQKKIDLIIQFAIRAMLCKYLNFSSNILVLDEIFDALDSVGCNNTVNFVTNKLRDINSVFIISHRADLDIPYDKEIRVVKNLDGVSSVF